MVIECNTCTSSEQKPHTCKIAKPMGHINILAHRAGFHMYFPFPEGETFLFKHKLLRVWGGTRWIMASL